MDNDIRKLAGQVSSNNLGDAERAAQKLVAEHRDKRYSHSLDEWVHVAREIMKTALDSPPERSELALKTLKGMDIFPEEVRQLVESEVRKRR